MARPDRACQRKNSNGYTIPLARGLLKGGAHGLGRRADLEADAGKDK